MDINANLDENTIKLIDQALEGKHRPIELVTNNITLIGAISIYTVNAKITRGFRKCSKMMYNMYLKKLRTDVDDVKLLLNFRTLDQCYHYFKIERNIVRDALLEYIIYLFGGNDLISLFAKRNREDYEMFSYLTGEWVGDVDDKSNNNARVVKS